MYIYAKLYTNLLFQLIQIRNILKNNHGSSYDHLSII